MSKTDATKNKRYFTNLFSALGVVQNRRNRAKILNICISLDLVFSFSIFGYISIKPIAVTTVHIPVIIAAMFLGPYGGAVTGLVFGLTSMWKASVSASAYGDIIFSPGKSGDPFGSIVLCIGMRVLFGLLTGMLFSLMFKRLRRKWYALGTVVVSVISTMLHSLLVTLMIIIFFPKAQSGSLASSIAPNLRHIAVWTVTALFLYFVYLAFSSKKFIMQYKKVVDYKLSHKTQGYRMVAYLMLAFLVVSAAVVMHTFDKLSLISITNSSKTDMIAVHLACQQLIALSGATYMIALVMLFTYDKANIASNRLKEKEQEEIYQKKLQKTLDVMEALTRDYEIVMNTDIEMGSVVLYRCSEQMAEIVDEPSLDMPFYEAGERFFRLIASQEDMPRLIEMTTKEKIEQYLKNDQIFVQVFKNKDGIYGETKIVPISDHEFVCGYTNVDKAIKEKMKQQEELERAMRAAEAANKAKSDFLLNMSHDIRTPMNAIIGYTDILAKYRQDEKQFERCTENIKASGKYLLDLINNVLEMSRIESGVEELNIAACDVNTLLGSTYIVFKEEAGKKGISLTFDKNIRHDYLYADKVKIQEIHFNIISNALKYTKPGGSVKIFLTELPGDKDGWCVIRTTTTDTGIGMSEDFLQHIFEDFAREQNSTTSGITGTGLGMGIVKKLVEMMGGTIKINSKKGEGTSVVIDIPHRIADESEVERESEVSDIDASLFKGKRILLAEDNDLNAEIAAELLGDVGLLVDRAQDGIICVSKLETSRAGYYDLILMDVQMPNMDGYQATQIIRKLSDKQKAQIPIIAMTANAFARDREAALNAGMNEHISKPISIDKLISVMSGFISK